jgi:putative membrane protein
MIDWTHWHNEPYLIGGLILFGWLYALFTGPLRSRIAPGAATSLPAAIRFYASLVVFYLAVGSPLDQIAERFLLTAHMVQHLLLIYISAVLFLTGLPGWLIAPIVKHPRLREPLRRLFHPVSCALIFILTLTVWHAPQLYDWALRDRLVHILEHVMFFGAALFFWWPVLSPSRDFPRISDGAQIIYLTVVIIGMTPLFLFMAFADNVLYPTYEYAPRLFANFSPLQDQIFGAALMKLFGMFVAFTAIAVAFYRWYRESEKKAGTVPARRP